MFHRLGEITPFVNGVKYYSKYCNNRFFSLKLDFAGNTITAENSSVDTNNSAARTETRHGFLVYGDLLRASFYGRQG